jgi:hypothetical protein
LADGIEDGVLVDDVVEAGPSPERERGGSR